MLLQSKCQECPLNPWRGAHRRLPSRSVNALPLGRRDRLALCDVFDELVPTRAPSTKDGRPPTRLLTSSHAIVVPIACRAWSYPLWMRGVSTYASASCAGHIPTSSSIYAQVHRDGHRWLRQPAADGMGNTHEFFVHYEDVRRCRVRGREPRRLDAAAEADICPLCVASYGARSRHSPVGVVSPGSASRRFVGNFTRGTPQDRNVASVADSPQATGGPCKRRAEAQWCYLRRPDQIPTIACDVQKHCDLSVWLGAGRG